MVSSPCCPSCWARDGEVLGRLGRGCSTLPVGGPEPLVLVLAPAARHRPAGRLLPLDRSRSAVAAGAGGGATRLGGQGEHVTLRLDHLPGALTHWPAAPPTHASDCSRCCSRPRGRPAIEACSAPPPTSYSLPSAPGLPPSARYRPCCCTTFSRAPALLAYVASTLVCEPRATSPPCTGCTCRPPPSTRASRSRRSCRPPGTRSRRGTCVRRSRRCRRVDRLDVLAPLTHVPGGAAAAAALMSPWPGCACDGWTAHATAGAARAGDRGARRVGERAGGLAQPVHRADDAG